MGRRDVWRKGSVGTDGNWRLRSRKDGAVWTAIASVAAVAVYGIVFGLFSGSASVYGAIGLGLGTLLGGLLGTLCWLPKENGS